LEIPFSKIIPRPRYVEKVRPYINKDPIKVFTGQRRVGKSYLLYQLMEEIDSRDDSSHIIYINKEDLAFDHIKTHTDLHQYVQKRSKNGITNYIFIDEIQEIDQFHKAVRSLSLHGNMDLYITGSNAELFSSKLATMLSGRTIEQQVFSLSYPEFLTFHNKEHSQNSLNEYLRYGGLPYLIHLELEPTVVFEYLKNIYQTILFRDVVSRYKLRSTAFLEQLVYYLADTTGSIFSAKNISDYLKSQRINMAHNQVIKFINHLKSAYLVRNARRFDIKGKKIFEIGEKFYFENIGIRNALVGYKPDDRGKIMENVVYNHLLYLNYTIHVGKWGDHEIDFVAERRNERLYVQVALRFEQDETIAREFDNLLAIKDNYPKIVVSMDDEFPSTYKGVRHMHLSTFLMKKDF